MNFKNYFDNKKLPLRIVLAIALSLVLTIVSICLINRTDERFFFSVDSFELKNKSEFSVGAGSDLSFMKIPHDFMTITYHPEDGDFSWSVDSRRDSLCYYQINGKNPNSHAITEKSTIQAAFRLPNGTLETVDISGKEIIEKASSFEDTKYSLLRNMVALIKNDSIGSQAKNDKTLASLIYKDEKTDEISLIILDRHTTLDGETTYVFNGHVSDLTPNRRGMCKVQFYNVKELCVRYKEVDPKSFHIDDLSYIVRPVIITTGWGAGHFMLKPKENNTISVNYPKGIIYSEKLDTLTSIANQQSGLITLKQYSNNPPIQDNIYLPRFSAAITSDVCYLKIKDGLLQMETNSCDSFDIASSFNIVPTFKRSKFTSGNETINCRYGIIDGKYILSYFCLPICMFIFILLTHLWLINRKEKGRTDSKTNQAKAYKTYFIAITGIALVYCIGKIMISFKLSYTYPYFEKLSGIIVVSSSLVLLFFYLVSLLINYDFIRIPALRQESSLKKHFRLFSPVVIGIFGLAITLVFLKKMDAGINAEVANSYFSQEWFSFRFWNWNVQAGINDTHRSVCYTMILASIIVIGLLFIQALMSYSRKWRDFSLFDKIDSLKFLNGGQKDNERKSFVVSICLYALNYLLIPCIIIAIIGLILKGNYATALITTVVIWSLTRALAGADKETALLQLSEMLLAIIAIMGVALLPDHGYLTNSFGFFTTLILFYFLIQKSKLPAATLEEERERQMKENRTTPKILLGLIGFAFVLPFIYNYFFSAENLDYSRSTRRFLMTTQFDEYQESGYRYADSDTEFMKIMFYYMNHSDGEDPLASKQHHLHPSISSGQSPVILNDVSLPSSYLSSYGPGAYFIYFALLFMIFYLVLTYSLSGAAGGQTVVFDRYTQWRLLAMLMWIGTSLYLFISYLGIFPFTGRLNPGFGIDAVGEALESSILLAFMTATRYKNEQ